MPRRRFHTPLLVYLNNRFVGRLNKAATGAISFQYDQSWLDWEHALPVSLSLPLREDPYRGEPVSVVFDNLLPDSDQLRRRVAEKVGATGTDAYSLLTAIGHDCIGALQFIPENMANNISPDTTAISGETVDQEAIERLLKGLEQAPLGLSRDDDFRISIAGAQEKTALLRYQDQWLKPHGTTPTTHIFKTQIGRLPNGIDLSNSVENEYYCLKLAALCDLPVNKAEIQTFGGINALVVERFDRKWTKDNRLLRLPQEDFCQALSISPTLKYQNQGGPNLIQMLKFLTGSDTPAKDQSRLLKAQILFWLIGATDGHAKNFSLFLAPGGRFTMTPLYDILTSQPSLDLRQIEQKQMKLALSVGHNNHYKFGDVQGRYFSQTAEAANLSKSLARDAMDDVSEKLCKAIETIETSLPPGFPENVHESVKSAALKRVETLRNEKINS